MGLWGSITRGAKAVATGGLSEMPETKDIINGLPGTLKDSVVAPNSYDANGHLADSEKKATAVYDQALGNAAMAGANPTPTADITAQTIADPAAIQALNVAAPDAIAARDVQASGLIAGDQATQLRQQALEQAQTAAASPSSAVAQMRAAGAQIQGQQLGQAAMARGADRASAKRLAMLGTGQAGLQAAGSTAALAAQENAQKQAALTQALQGVRAGDVTASNALAGIGQANQAADIATGQANAANALTAGRANAELGLTAATATGAQTLEAAKANQAADLTAQQADVANKQAGWVDTNQAKNAFLNTALQGVGAQNQAQGVAAGYGAKENDTRQKAGGSLLSGIGSAFGLSDESVKEDVSPIGGRLSSGLKTMGAELQDLPHPSMQTGGAGPGQNFLDWKAAPIESGGNGSSGGGLSSLVTAAGPALAGLSDERAKRDVERMDDGQVADWAESVPTAVWRYSEDAPDDTDQGAAYHTGTLAQSLQKTGPLGKLMVHERPDGLKQVEYGPLGLMMGKGALARADEALDWARAAYALAADKGGKGLQHG